MLIMGSDFKHHASNFAERSLVDTISPDTWLVLYFINPRRMEVKVNVSKTGTQIVKNWNIFQYYKTSAILLPFKCI